LVVEEECKEECDWKEQQEVKQHGAVATMK
jgi:hypothetical protein